MDGSARLALLKNDLLISAATTVYDTFLAQLLSSAAAMIEREGITLDLAATNEDNQLVIMYAAYLFRSRNEPNAQMPRSLRWALNNRVFSEKGRVIENAD